jgi:hypothetical protein
MLQRLSLTAISGHHFSLITSAQVAQMHSVFIINIEVRCTLILFVLPRLPQRLADKLGLKSFFSRPAGGGIIKVFIFPNG